MLRKISSALLASAAIMSLSSAALAADVETVTVTGTRIPHANVEAPTAVTTISSEVLQMSGTVNVSDMLRSVPSFGVSGISSTNSNFQTSGAGINTLELRNLGESRTLVLVNGRRYVSGVAGSSAVDFNTVPTDLIDRVEVITGGASAVYGSDALAGVINVILKTDYEGLTADAQSGRTEYDDEITYKAHVMFGSNFANNKGNVVVSATYSKNEGVMAVDRADLRSDTLVSGAKSSYSAYGRFIIPSTGQSFALSSGTGPTGTVTGFSSAKFGFDRQPWRAIETPIERLMFAANGHYNISNTTQFYFESTFANTRSSANIEPYPHSSGDLDGGYDMTGISIDNPYMPATIRNAAIAAGDNYVDYTRRLAEFGPRHYDANRDMWRIVTGAKGTIFKDYAWDVYFDWGHTLDVQNGTGQINIPNMREALQAHVATAADVANGAVVGGAPASVGQVICNNTIAQLEGCSPINLFGLGAVDKAALKYVVAPQSRTDNIDEQVLGGSIAGPVFALPAGDVSLVGGFEYRREQASDVPDALSQSGQNAGNKEPETRGGYHVLEFFAETEVPILKNEFLAKEVTLGGAIRWSQYGTGQSTTITNAYTGRISWSPIDDLRIRGQYAKAVRAPSINEMFAPGGEDFAAVDDICDGITASSHPSRITDQTAANCRSVPTIAQRIAATGSYTLTLAEQQGTGGISGRGSQDLTPEKSDTWTIGAVYSHDFGGYGALNFSVDYFNIDIQNVITTVGRQAAIEQCYGAASYPNQFCNMVVRRSVGAAYQLGAITEINSGYGNQGYIKESGVDISLMHNVDLNEFGWLKGGAGDIGLTDAGQLSTRMDWTYTNSFSDEAFGTVTNDNGTVGIPKHKIQAAMVYQNGPITFQWAVNFQSRVVISRDENSAFYLKPVRSYHTHDISLSYDITDQFQLYGGVVNAFNISAPRIMSGTPGNTTGTNTAADVYDTIGRRFFVGGRVKL